ncbi:MAG TPA: sulfate adenylyltransferase subunit CysD [Thermodesulfobacteriota bacterium]|nr:sulfate adenylyltransferase subunit CysD [Thermodesulfobacteriota bacterium]
MDHLTALENKSIFIIREAYYRFRNIAMLWSVGKDSTTLLWLCRKAFFGKIPFPVIHIDTTYKFPEMYRFRDEYARKWGLELIVGRNEGKVTEGMGPGAGSKLECCNELKTNALKLTIKKHGFKALLLGIRRDEHGIRAKERVFSPRDENFRWNYEDQPAELWDQYKCSAEEEDHVRVHPILHMTELDIWRYIKREDIPVTGLYFNKEGKRYRSIGCVPCCSPVDSMASNIDEVIEELEKTKTSERAGRAQDKEDAYTMQKLRSLGYM